MNSDAVWNMTEKSRLKREDEVRMQELRHLFDLMDEREEEWQVTKTTTLEKALKILSWCDLDVAPGLAELKMQQPIDIIEQHRKWLKAFRSAMPYLAKMLLVTDSTLLIKLRCTLERYAEISYPNLLVVIQPKLQTLNFIKA